MSKIAIPQQWGWNIFIVWLGVAIGTVVGAVWGTRPYVTIGFGIFLAVSALFLGYCTKDKVPVEVQSEGDATHTPRDKNLQA